MSHSTNASATASATAASATASSRDLDEAAAADTHCSICADHYTAVLRKKVECSFCHKATCSKCVENYLMSRHEDAHCLHCRVNYSDATLRGICTQTYLKNKYYKHRQEVLMNRERAALPGLQDTAIAAKKTRDDMKEANEVHKTLLEMRRERKTHLIAYHQVNMEYHQLPADNITERATLRLQLDEMRATLEDMADRVREYRRDYYEMRWNARYGAARAVTDQAIADGAAAQAAQGAAGGAAAAAEEKKTFIRRCLRDGCQGFLSTAWKCGLCEWYSCGTCLTVKGETRDSAHECKKEDVETAELIRKDSKSCPNCGQYIQKSSGCFAKDTPVLLWDGTIILAQDVHQGHELVGDDGTKRTVLDTVTGEDEMYEVKQQTGMTYTVNAKHTLVLKYMGASEPIEILVEDYMKLPQSTKDTLFGFKGTTKGKGTTTGLTDVKERGVWGNVVSPSAVGRGTYHGWRLDGNHLFQMPDSTVVRNCSQMFCISCQTPFDWETGKIVTKGAIHNPHYYEWMARNGGLPRNPQDIPCGGYPNAWDLYRVQPRSLTVRQGPQWTHFVDFHRICMDIQDLGARSYRSHMDQGAVQELHVQFLLGDMTEEQWGRRLAQLEKKRKRDSEIQEVFAAFHMVAVDMVARVTRHEEHQTSEDWRMRLRQWEEEMFPFLDMINDAFRSISKSYAYATPTICSDIDPHTLQRFYMMRTHNVMAPRKTVANVGGESATGAASAGGADSDSDVEA
jgi:hypothetical protein